VAGLEWLSSRDGKVREAHVHLDGQTVPVGGEFTVNGIGYHRLENLEPVRRPDVARLHDRCSG
jgi:hypothetical protein